ncbi:hypothetical protein [Limnobacter sp.]|uniref:hypothetical protein n=1 Tax=Limnobacter sp. TaxID=2003368 RepID=UPI003512A203
MTNQDIPTQKQLLDLTCDRLYAEVARLAQACEESAKVVGLSHFELDDFLPADVAAMIAQHFPDTEKMFLMDSLNERKYTFESFDGFHPLIKSITFAVQYPQVVVAIVEKISGIQQQLPDPSLSMQAG